MLARSRYAPMLSIQTVSISDHVNRSKPAEDPQRVFNSLKCLLATSLQEITTAVPQQSHGNAGSPVHVETSEAGRCWQK